jgi:lipopolysaccharide/colanic/teichoic acid biosynthesis glycosyltransferase
LPGAEKVAPQRFTDVAAALQALQTFEAPSQCREILVAVSSSDSRHLAALAEMLNRQPVPASIALEGVSFAEVHATPSFVLFSTNPTAAGAFDYMFSKRLVDLMLSGVGLIVFMPLMFAVAAVTWLRSGRPVLFAQERVGRGGRRFSLYKFRTLPVASLADSDRRWASPPADAWGRFLRATGLDELPQLYNVLRGEMSLVGPRPERPHFVEQFRRQLPFYSTRHRLQAGITGWAQVNGWRGDTSIARRVEHDLHYLRHWSLALDFRILWMTLKNFVRHLRGVAVATTGAPDARHV